MPLAIIVIVDLSFHLTDRGGEQDEQLIIQYNTLYFNPIHTLPCTAIQLGTILRIFVRADVLTYVGTHQTWQVCDPKLPRI